MAAHVAFAAGSLCAIGGIAGYIRARSIPSLIAGTTFGALFATAGYLVNNNKDYGVELALGTSVLLVAAMGPRAARSRKPMPTLVALIGTLAGAYYAKKYYNQINGF